MINRNKIKDDRWSKAEKLAKIGINPYPSRVKKTYNIAQAIDNFGDLIKKEKEISLVGRIMSMRLHGGSAFFDIQDGSGRMQVFAGKDTLGPKLFDFLKDSFDLGDFIQIAGILFVTKTGAKTLKASNLSMAAKALFPLPSEWYGIKDPELRYRQRYLDILLDEDIKKIFKTRSQLIKEIRSFLDKEGFLEVETPILQVQYGGAKAKPFRTHLNALDMEVFMRISPELYLKRLLIGGFDKVYEIGRNFRNEGIDRTHNPEFTMLEFYWAYIDYKDLMKFTEKLFSHFIKRIHGKTEFTYNGQKIDFKTPWPRLEFRQIIQKETGINLSEVDAEALLKKAGKLGVDIPKGASKAEIADFIYKKHCRSKIWQPSFIIHHPIGFFPLAKESSKIPGYTENFQLVAAGWELINAFSEQNNPMKQREIFEAQEKIFKMGYEEAQRMDEDFLMALEYGMPPAAGFGMGIDRLAAFMANVHSLRETIFFPTTRPK